MQMFKLLWAICLELFALNRSALTEGGSTIHSSLSNVDETSQGWWENVALGILFVLFIPFISVSN